jgi:hypothetical protein
MTDNHEYYRSIHAQNKNDCSPYTDKQNNSYINDIILLYIKIMDFHWFDSICVYISGKFTDANDLFPELPIMTVAAYSTPTA